MRDVTYVVLLNWRGWSDTIACLESVFAGGGAPLRVIVCDNASGDGSLEKISAWASGELEVESVEQARLARLLGRAPRPLRQRRITKEQAESGDVVFDGDLMLVDNGANLGFAAGNNVGLRLALSQNDMGNVWLLNNDTMVEPDCLLRMRDRLAAAPGLAVCGSVIHFFDRPEIVQALGGNRFNHFTGVAHRSEGRFVHEKDITAQDAQGASLAYLSGCSMLLPRRFLEDVGLMGEQYFLYYEEIDWFTRANGRFELLVEPAARIYHREGSSIGSPGWQRSASAFADYHLYRSRLRFMRCHYRRYLPVAYLAAWLDVGKCLLRRQFANARAVVRVLLGLPQPGAPA
ncbi:glycosyltransferase [Halioglobus maricola]|uniref:Glycosyltransferase n=1 Tax=Halioglobus maricola TaxID=2601894 RepID=A0A5P9NNU0_9GAMM|nr:glycosyltransferase [Halioglobus maricola]QFU77166.1 glycosyltransferase [Halioglobus maricola]